MLFKNILQRRKKSSIIVVMIIIIMVIYVLETSLTNIVYAVQTKENYSDKIKNYPEYSKLVDELKVKYPNWNFTFLYTGLDWNEVLKSETIAQHGRSLVGANKSSSYWFCQTCGDKKYDNGSWKCASEVAVAYYMDPRNWINEDFIFQFEDLSYNEKIQNIDGVKQILKNTWMSGDTTTYTDTSGKKQTIKKSYAQIIMEAAKSAGISPYHLAARIRQEQGIKVASATGSGNYKGYIGYYNLLNIKASGQGSAAVARNGLDYAKQKGWNTPEKSITAGAKFLAEEYISVGQSTLYLQKFDVDNSDNKLYYHQYMQNIEAAQREGNDVKNSYQEMGLLNSNINFIIPVFEKMPTEISEIPGSHYFVTQNVSVNGIDVVVRNAKGLDSDVIGKVNKGDNLLRIEIATGMVDGYYWDKIVLPNGSKGYISRKFIKEVEDITNTNELVVTNTGVNLRNGPGIVNTSVIITLSKGQAVTVIENGKYNGIDGYNWARVKLSNGMQGYLASDYINLTSNGKDTSGNIIATVNANSVRLRKGIGTSTDIVTTLNTGDVVTIIQKNAGTANGFTWDKIVTSGGLEGYFANKYLTVKENNTTSTPTTNTATPTVPTSSKPVTTVKANDNFKIDNTNVICEPTTTVSTIKSSNSSTVVTNKDGKTLGDNDLIGTGCKIKMNNSEYTVIKKGDVNGDGEVKATDYMTIKNHIMGESKLSDAEKKAADCNNDNSIKATDYMTIKNHIMGIALISL